MNQQPNILLFSVILGAVFLLLDLYVLGHWTQYVRRKEMNPWWHRSLWIVGTVMAVFYWVVVCRRHFFRMDTENPDLYPRKFSGVYRLPDILNPCREKP